MPLLDLTQITLNKTFAGICCPACSGRLELAQEKKRFWARVFSRNTKSRICYRCQGCRKIYILTQRAL